MVIKCSKRNFFNWFNQQFKLILSVKVSTLRFRGGPQIIITSKMEDRMNHTGRLDIEQDLRLTQSLLADGNKSLSVAVKKEMMEITSKRLKLPI